MTSALKKFLLIAFLFFAQWVCNRYICREAWYKYYPLVIISIIPSSVALFAGRHALGAALIFIQSIILIWFNSRMCSFGGSGHPIESSFVGGLGIMYYFVYSIAACFIVLVVSFVFNRRGSSGND